MRSPMALASSMAAEQKSRTSGSSSIRSMVAPVNADTGFIVRLPHNLYQMSCRTSAEATASKPASRSSVGDPLDARRPPPAGSPTIRPAGRWCAAPGRARGTRCRHGRTQPSTCSNGIAAAMAPPGSTLCQRRVAERGDAPAEPPRHAVHRRQHDRVAGRAAARCRARHGASAGPLTAITTRSCTPSSAGIVRGGGQRRADRCLAALQPPAVLAQRRQRGAAGDGAHFARAGCGEPRAEEPPIAPAPTMQTFMGVALQAAPATGRGRR